LFDETKIVVRNIYVASSVDKIDEM
jgi:hypothetical protein